jgi:hypothetical protein
MSNVEMELLECKQLQRLVSAELTRAQSLAEEVEGGEYTNVREVGAPPSSHSDPHRDAFEAMCKLGGLSVPAARRLCASENPVDRIYGVLAIHRLTAVGSIDVLRELAIDGAIVNGTKVRQIGDDWTSYTTVRECAEEALRTKSAFRRLEDPTVQPSVSADIELYIHAACSDLLRSQSTMMLMNSLRETTGEANSWEQWWNAARPTWNAWWAITISYGDTSTRDAEWAHRQQSR